MMVDMDPRYTSVLNRMALFKGLSLSQMEGLFDHFSLSQLGKGETLFSQGERGDRFYIIISGKVLVFRGRQGHREELAIFGSGDYFGEEALLTGRPRTATIIGEEPSQLLWMNREGFAWLLKTYPPIRQFLLATVDSHRLARSRKFDWLKKGEETVYIVTRKHTAYLFVMLIQPLLLSWLSIPFFYLALTINVSSFRLILEWIGIIILSLSILWGIWRAIDWGNDYYIVTNQRVVWIEKVIGIYDSRQEAPLSTVLTVGVQTDYTGRWLGYGNVVVRTYTGQIVMRRVGFPEQLAGLIEEHLGRAKQQVKKAETAALEEAIRTRLGYTAPARPKPSEPSPVEKKPARKPGFFSNFFTLRFEEQQGIVTFRKHWFLLVQKDGIPTLLILLLLAVMVARLIGVVKWFTIPMLLLVGITFLLILGLWWLYQYVDWRNDIYQVTPEQIVDIYRTPLGKEDKKTAQLENILSLQHTRRGILGILLNYGDVTAMIGAVKFTFQGVYDPAGVEQEIFQRINARKLAQREAEANRQREQVADWFAAYHRQTEAMRRTGNPPNSDQNSG
jgi:hypothetical protein